MAAAQEMALEFINVIPDDPSDADVSRLLLQMESCMVATRQTNAPEGFVIVWRDKLHDFAFLMDYYGKRVMVLRETGGNNLTWCEV